VQLPHLEVVSRVKGAQEFFFLTLTTTLYPVCQILDLDEHRVRGIIEISDPWVNLKVYVWCVGNFSYFPGSELGDYYYLIETFCLMSDRRTAV
jgi:hypothetical protein